MLKIRRYHKNDLGAVAKIVFSQWKKFIVCDCTPEGAKYWRNYLEPTKANIKSLAKRYGGDTIAFVATNDEKIVGAEFIRKQISSQLVKTAFRWQILSYTPPPTAG